MDLPSKFKFYLPGSKHTYKVERIGFHYYLDGDISNEQFDIHEIEVFIEKKLWIIDKWEDHVNRLKNN